MATTNEPALGTATANVVPAATLLEWIERDEVLLVDVRESTEFAQQRIAGARLVPLSSFEAEAVATEPGKRVVLYCAGGPRSQQAAAVLVAQGRRPVWTLDGGIYAWRRQGYATVGRGRFSIDVQRQVFLVVAAMILPGTALGVWVSPWFLLLPLIAGLGLANAGLTGLCPMATLLAKMPWNSGTCAAKSCSSGSRATGQSCSIPRK
jgi:rhodanese-related sulfurtransferase